MMQLKFKIIMACLPVFFIGFMSCEKEKCGFGTDTDYVTFGHFYGQCFGEGCVEIFRVDHATLYEDTLDMYPNSDDFYPGHFVAKLADSKYELVKDLDTFFPEALLNETEVVQGQPDAGDWGGIYFEIQRGTTHRFWLLDQNETNMPAAYNAFVDKINEKIAIIQQ